MILSKHSCVKTQLADSRTKRNQFQLPTSDTRDIHQAVLTLGGQTRRELTREVTHLICMSESGRKYESAMKYGAELGMQVVLPHW